MPDSHTEVSLGRVWRAIYTSPELFSTSYTWFGTDQVVCNVPAPNDAVAQESDNENTVVCGLNHRPGPDPAHH